MYDKIIRQVSWVLLIGGIVASGVLANTGWAILNWGAILLVASFALLIVNGFWPDQVEALLGKIAPKQNSDSE